MSIFYNLWDYKDLANDVYENTYVKVYEENIQYTSKNQVMTSIYTNNVLDHLIYLNDAHGPKLRNSLLQHAYAFINFCAKYDFVSIVKWAHENLKLDLNRKWDGWAPIHVSTRFNSDQVTAYLCRLAAAGTLVDLQVESINSTLPHHFTSHHGNFAMTILLLTDFKLDPYKCDAQGDNLAHQAVACQQADRWQDVMQILKMIWRSYPSLLYAPDFQGRTPVQICLMYLPRHNRLDYLVWLLTVARVPIRDKNNENKDCYDLAENKNKKFEKNVREVLNFTEKQRRADLRKSMFLMNINVKMKNLSLINL